MTGALTAISIDQPSDWQSAGALTAGAERLLIPAGLQIQLTGGDTLTLQQLFTRAPARCAATRESGLLPSDVCRRPPRDERHPERAWTPEADPTPVSYLDPVPTDEAPVTVVRATATRDAAGSLVAATVALGRGDTLSGAVTFVNEADGYLRVNGAMGADAGGAVLRINDPDGRISTQSGLGCGGEGNCSPDLRFKADAAGRSVRFESGFRACVPAGPGGACPRSARPAEAPVPDGAILPILEADHITAQGGFEVHHGVRIFWSHLVVDHSPATK